MVGKLIDLRKMPVEGVEDAFTMQVVFKCIACWHEYFIEFKEHDGELEKFMKSLEIYNPNRDIRCPVCVGKAEKEN